MRIRKLRVRQWLNKVGYQSTANIFIDYGGGNFSQNYLDSIEVDISDCTRKIQLIFPVKDSDFETVDNSLHKVRVLLDAFSKVEDRLLAAKSYQDSRR